MEIDGFTFAAQVLNFLILVALLRHFLYGPVIEAVDRREREIESRIDDAEGRRREALEEAEELREERRRLEEEREERRREVEREVRGLREELLEEAREEAREARRRWEETLRREREAFLADLRDLVAREAYRTLREAVAELADEELETRMAEVLLARLDELSPEERDELAAAASASGRVVVASRFPLPEEVRRRLAGALRGLGVPVVDLDWEVDPDVGAGVEVVAGDRKIGWSLESHLADLERRVAGRLGADAASVVGPGREPAGDGRAGARGGTSPGHGSAGPDGGRR